MIQENESSSAYLKTDLSAEEQKRLVKELEDNPQMLRELLQHQTPEDEAMAEMLLFNEFDEAGQDDLDKQIRSYLLRDPTVEDEKFAELEESLIEDERYLERMMLVERELIEDYQRDALTADEKDRFDTYFLGTPERRKKLKFIEALMTGDAFDGRKVKEDSAAAESVSVKPHVSSWHESLLAFFRSSNLFVGTATAAILLFLVVGGIWWFNNSSEKDDLIATAPTNESISNLNRSENLDLPENSNQTDNLNQSANTNKVIKPTPAPPVKSPTPAKLPPTNQTQKQTENPTPTPTVKPPENAPRSVFFALFPGSLRGGSDGQKIEPNTETVSLRLLLNSGPRYNDYQIIVQDFGNNEIGRREKLKASKGYINVSFPAADFQPNLYEVILKGKKNGEYVPISTYNFEIIK